MAKWVDSYRDLPLLLNQWANIVRWELRPRTFLRTTEFLWQEGHTAHVSEEDARDYARRIHRDVYEDFMVQILGIPVVPGRKTKGERFAGATNTMTLEAMMRDTKALQMGTSHELGQNFAKAFDISFTSSASTVEHAWTTSWGTSTRMMGGLIMVHGDDSGLRLPPRLAPVQAQVMVVKAGEGVLEAAAQLLKSLQTAGVRAKLDDRADVPFGRRAVDAELQGIPVRIEVGPRDLAAGNVVVVRRFDGSKSPVPLDAVAGEVVDALQADQQRLYDDALRFREDNTVEVRTLGDAIEAAQTGWARVPWSAVGNDGEAEANGKAVTVRCLIRADGSMPDSDDEPDLVAILARSY
jgi:prolyl-tRNA synthetase